MNATFLQTVIKKRHLCKSYRCLKSNTPHTKTEVSQIPIDVT